MSGNFPQKSAELQQLPGIGPYTAAAIAAICFNEQIAVVDGNVERLIARYLALEMPTKNAKNTIRSFVQDVVPPRAGDFAQTMMDLGAMVCTPRVAHCSDCPLSQHCLANKSGTPLRFPVRAPKKTRPTRYGHAFVFRRSDDAVFLSKRPEKGLLAQMAGVPGSAWTACRTDVDFPQTGNWTALGDVKHTFTHFHLILAVWELKKVGKMHSNQGWWAKPDTLDQEALPSLFRKVLALSGIG